ncbi:MAG: site-2 protease family protein [Clostridia bacterium]|nr:site-2 protease family protein [Clostridia bacterium]
MIIGIILAVLVFGFLIFIHEFGHYIFARIFGVKINEFSMGMGPKIISKNSKKTGIAYSVRILPIGGFVAMAGEDEESDDPAAFCNKPVWQRMIITAAGATVNIIAGIIAMAVIVVIAGNLQGTTVEYFGTFQSDEIVYHSTEEQGIAVGDRIVKIGDTKVHISDDLRYEIMMNGASPVDVTVIRDGETVTIEDVKFSTLTQSGLTFGYPDFLISAEATTPESVLRHTLWGSVSMMRSIWDSLTGLVRGDFGVEMMSGPVGIGTEMVKIARESYIDFARIAVLISINLGIMNLLPLPALDGGRLVFQFIELIFRRPVNRNIEGYIHFGGIVILMAFMLFITFKDIFALF